MALLSEGQPQTFTLADWICNRHWVLLLHLGVRCLAGSRMCTRTTFLSTVRPKASSSRLRWAAEAILEIPWSQTSKWKTLMSPLHSPVIGQATQMTISIRPRSQWSATSPWRTWLEQKSQSLVFCRELPATHSPTSASPASISRWPIRPVPPPPGLAPTFLDTPSWSFPSLAWTCKPHPQTLPSAPPSLASTPSQQRKCIEYRVFILFLFSTPCTIQRISQAFSSPKIL